MVMGSEIGRVAAVDQPGFGDMKVRTTVKRTFLEFVPAHVMESFENGDAHKPSRSRAHSDGSVEYGEYVETPTGSTLAPSTSDSDSDHNGMPSTSDSESDHNGKSSSVVTSDDLQEREEMLEVGCEVTQSSVPKEFVDPAWFRLNSVTNGGHGNAPCYYPMQVQDPYCQNWGGVSTSMGFQAIHLRAQAQEAAEAAARLRAKAAQCKVQAHETKDSLMTRVPWNTDKNSQGNLVAPLTQNSRPLQFDRNGRGVVAEASACLPGPPATPILAVEELAESPKLLTTLMLRNIPNQYTRDALLGLIESFGFHGCCDFIYLPMDFHKGAGLGYAFVNFASEKDAESVRQMFEGFCSWGHASQKVCEVSFSHPLQGLKEHIEQHRNSCVMHELVPDSHKPALYEGGVRQPFPLPTKHVSQPRRKRGFLGYSIK